MNLLEHLQNVKNNPKSDSLEKLIFWFEDMEVEADENMSDKLPTNKHFGRILSMFLNLDIETGDFTSTKFLGDKS